MSVAECDSVATLQPSTQVLCDYYSVSLCVFAIFFCLVVLILISQCDLTDMYCVMEYSCNQLCTLMTVKVLAFISIYLFCNKMCKI